MTPSPRPRRAPAPALFVLSAVLLVLAPVVGVVALAILPRHGDGLGAIGDAVMAGSIVLGLSALALLLGTVFALVERSRGPRGAAPDQ